MIDYSQFKAESIGPHRWYLVRYDPEEGFVYLREHGEEATDFPKFYASQDAVLAAKARFEAQAEAETAFTPPDHVMFLGERLELTGTDFGTLSFDGPQDSVILLDGAGYFVKFRSPVDGKLFVKNERLEYGTSLADGFARLQAWLEQDAREHRCPECGRFDVHSDCCPMLGDRVTKEQCEDVPHERCNECGEQTVAQTADRLQEAHDRRKAEREKMREAMSGIVVDPKCGELVKSTQEWKPERLFGTWSLLDTLPKGSVSIAGTPTVAPAQPTCTSCNEPCDGIYRRRLASGKCLDCHGAEVQEIGRALRERSGITKPRMVYDEPPRPAISARARWHVEHTSAGDEKPGWGE